MDAQIIISREDNTDFLSLGYIQTDTSLVSALGGALTNFAEEIGLAGEQREEDKLNNINFSRFQNGILASKMVRVNEHTPIILIAVKGFSGKDSELNFLVDYASLLAKGIVTKFEDHYSSIGLIPKIDDATDVITSVANKTCRQASDKVRLLTKHMKTKINELLELLWKNQGAFEPWAKSMTQKDIAYLSQSEILNELAKYFYIQGIKSDAMFPLVFGSSSNPYNEIKKIINNFLAKKVSIAKKEIINEVTKIVTQLRDSSKALIKRDVIEIPDVELINESFIFEKVLVSKTNNFESVVNDVLSKTNQDLYRKLFQKYPLKFIAMSKESVFDKKQLIILFKQTLTKLLKDEITDENWFEEKSVKILRGVTSKYSPNEIMKKEKQIIEKFNTDFINSLKKEHPFILIADPTLALLTKEVKKNSDVMFKRFTTTLDEAVVLNNAIGQIHTNLTKEKSPSTLDLMILYFLQQVIQPYQFREVPKLVYALIAESIGKTSYSRENPSEIIEKSLKQFEKKINFQIVPETKKLVLNRITKAKPSLQRFENFENLAYFFKSFRLALENTLDKILQTIFGPEKFPNAPNVMSGLVKRIPQDIQNVFAISQIIDRITKRPNGRELFSNSATKALEKNTKFKQILPTPLELAQVALDKGWIKPVEQKGTKYSASQMLSKQVKISSMKLQGELDKLLRQTSVMSMLWVKFSSQIIESRQKPLKTRLAAIEKQSKVSAGDTTGRQKYGALLKQFRNINRWINNIVVGGRIKFFTTSKDLQQTALEISKNLHPIFKSNPDNFQLKTDDSIMRKFSSISPIKGDFQDLMQVYAALWIADSNHVETLVDNLFWSGLMKTNGQNTNGSALDRKINNTLKTSYKKESISDKKAIIRQTMVEDVVPAFNEIVRMSLAQLFNEIKNDRIVVYDEKSNDWYVSLGKINASRNALKNAFNTLGYVKLVKISDDTTEIRLILTRYYSLKRSKEAQTLEEFIRKATFNRLNKKEVKALELFNDLNEKYIGKEAADTFYSYIRSLAQLIITPIN
ncbi:MAG: hypothetical protein FK733_06350 [Asgard group archaeon]|nr:hypothetical protein [Asgard group archaeon]